MKKLILSIAALGAIILTLGLTSGTTIAAPAPTPTPRPRVAPQYDLRVGMACSPLTSSQAAKQGDPQKCRIRVQNWSSSPITAITVSHPTSSTLVNTTYTGPFTLAPGAQVIIVENLTFNMTQDGRGKTTATATGLKGATAVSASGTEQKSLP